MTDAELSLTERLTKEGRSFFEQMAQKIATIDVESSLSRLGYVVDAGDGVATVHGLHAPVAGELLEINGVSALAEIVSESSVRVVLLGASARVWPGASVRRTGRVLDVPAGIELVGRVLDPLGRPLDRRGALRTRRRVPVEGEASAKLSDREPVSRPLRTGVFVIDTMIPVGRGQRQLIVGDRSTGKTHLCLGILAALDPEVIGIYVGIGRRGSDTSANLAWLEQRGFFEHGFAVIANADQPVGLVQLAPEAAMAMAEELMNQGRDVVIVFDDLTAHAHAHRTLALLLGRPVGREAYPVDVFYAHARVLERAAQLGRSRGGGSLSAFPIIETQAGDLTAYIPTNLVSITDGQIRLDAGLMSEGQLPAIDVGLSVSRVGGKAQPRMVRKMAGQLKHRYAQFLELEAFTRFGARVESHAQRIIDWGRRVRIALRQQRAHPLDWAETVSMLYVLADPRLIAVPYEATIEVLAATREHLRIHHADVWARLQSGALVREDDERVIASVLDLRLPQVAQASDAASAEAPE